DDIAADCLHGEALDDQRIETVEGAEYAFDHPAAFRRVRINVRGGGEIGRQRRCAMHGDGGRSLHGPWWRESESGEQAAERGAAGELRRLQALESTKGARKNAIHCARLYHGARGGSRPRGPWPPALRLRPRRNCEIRRGGGFPAFDLMAQLRYWAG